MHGGRWRAPPPPGTSWSSRWHCLSRCRSQRGAPLTGPPSPTLGCSSWAWPTCSCRGQFRSCRSEEHTSELQSHLNLVCRLLLEKKKTQEISQLVDRRHHVRKA